MLPSYDLNEWLSPATHQDYWNCAVTYRRYKNVEKTVLVKSIFKKNSFPFMFTIWAVANDGIVLLQYVIYVFVYGQLGNSNCAWHYLPIGNSNIW